MDERKRAILRAIVEGYIENAEPVGSRSIAKSTNLNLSAATIRNEMGDLEDMGYLVQPHTSAGRIPTGQGFRFYVDSLMDRYRMTSAEIKQLRSAMLHKIRELDEVVKDVSAAFSNVTNLPTVGMVPTIEYGVVKSIKLISVDEKTLMLIVVDNSGLIKNKLLRLKKAVDDNFVLHLTQVLNQNLTGYTPSEINLNNIVEVMNAAGGNQEILTSVLELVNEVISEIDRRDVYIEGKTNILKFPEYSDITRLKEFLEFFDNKQNLNAVMKHMPQLKDGEVSVFIGDENGLPELKDSSVVLSTYKAGANLTGVIGVIGPIRMDYSRVVTGLGYFSKQLGEMLSNALESGNAKDISAFLNTNDEGDTGNE